MKKFLLKVSLFAVLTLSLVSYNSIWGIVRMYASYRYPLIGSMKISNPNENKEKDILLIGCSNLQHNLDYTTIQNGLKSDIDFIYFSGSQSSTFLYFLKDLGLLKGYKTIIFYMPYHLFKKSKLYINNTFHYETVASFIFIKSLIKHNPSLIFYDWNAYRDSTGKYNKIHRIPDYLEYGDKYKEQLNNTIKSYMNCNEKFNPYKHAINIPKYLKEDVQFLDGIVENEQKYYIIFTPIPNIHSNLEQIKNEKITTIGFKGLLNKPYAIDSNYFYDQWYHLNKCGSKLESANIIQVLNKINLSD